MIFQNWHLVFSSCCHLIFIESPPPLWVIIWIIFVNKTNELKLKSFAILIQFSRLSNFIFSELQNIIVGCDFWRFYSHNLQCWFRKLCLWSHCKPYGINFYWTTKIFNQFGRYCRCIVFCYKLYKLGRFIKWPYH
jgi:hypothetical protein